MAIIEQIKAEIERLTDELELQARENAEANNGEATDYCFGVVDMQMNLLSFLDTLESEKPMNQEELEEEYKDYVVNDHVYSKLVNRNAGLVIARHFAQWGAKHLADDSKTSPNDLEEAARHSEILTYPMPEDGDIEKVFKVQEARFFHEIGFIAGAKWQKEQDEKEQADLFTIVALDAAQRAKEQMMKEAVEGEVVKDWDNNLSVKSATISGFKFGDKVHVIVLPKEY